MKRIITAALVSLVAAGVLTGCVFAPPAHAPETPPPTTEQSSVEASNPPDESAASEPTTEPTQEVTAPSADEVFLTVVRDEIPWTQQESDADLIALGQQACKTVGQIGFEETIFSLATDGNLTEQEMLDLSFIVGAAVGAYCPEYL